jgi:hypothetical protein
MRVATLVARNANGATAAPMARGGESVAKPLFGGSMDSGGRFWVGAFGRNLASVAVRMFSHFAYFKKKCYKCCSFNAICKYNAAINCVTVQHKQGSFPSTVTNNTTLV